MAGITSSILLPLYEAYLDFKPVRFDFLRIGNLCNGSLSFSFSDAFCHLDRIISPRILGPQLGVPLGIYMNLLFKRGFDILKGQKSEEVMHLTQEETRAFESLQNFLLKADLHEKCLLNAYEKMKSELSKETVLSMALAEHLFSQLASGYSCIINARVQGKVPEKMCKCGCNSPVNFDATGVGHSKVWHGYVDIIIKDESPIETIRVVTDPIVLDARGDFGPSTAKKSKTEDDEDVSLPSISEVKLKIRDSLDQAVAQTIVFALVNEQPMDEYSKFIPNIVICQKYFCIIMYDPENDILIKSEVLDLWSTSPGTLSPSAIISLWMVIHYKLFGRGGGIIENVDEVKAKFFDCIGDEKKEFYKQLAIGVSSFETEDSELLADTSSMFESVKIKSSCI